jgi:hypothetical protein
MFLSFASPLLLSGLWLTCSFGFVKGKKAREFEAEIKMLQDASNRLFLNNFDRTVTV